MTESAGGAQVLPGPSGALAGRMRVPTSKSLTNRALILAAAAGGGTIRSALDCEDTKLLAAALGRAGWPVDWHGDDTVVVGRRVPPAAPPRLDLGNSGTGSRLVLGLLASVEGAAVVDGAARLRERPMGPLLEALGRLGARLDPPEATRLPVTVHGGRLRGGRVTIQPEVSSQFVTALLLAAPNTAEGIDLVIEGPLPSTPYLDLTREMLEAFGADVAVTGDRRRWRVGPGLRAAEVAIEGDWSAAAFPLAAAAVAGGRVAVGPLEGSSSQGDRVVVDILVQAGLAVEPEGRGLVAHGPAAHPVEADLSACPDVFPALVAALACAAPGSRLTGLGALVHKESDRLGVMVRNLECLGAVVERSGESVRIIAPVEACDTPRAVTAAADHRIAMAMAVTALAAGPLELDDPSCVVKSFPGFWPAWAGLLAGRGEAW